MLNHKYVPDPNKLFDDVDGDDVTSAQCSPSRVSASQHSRLAPSRPYGGNSSHMAEMDHQRQAMLRKQREIEQRTLDSSARSIALLRDSEDQGIAIAVEFSHQREQLENTNRRLDDINTNLNYSQRHLNGIKSYFYELKNYISGKIEQSPPTGQASSHTLNLEANKSTLRDTIDNISIPAGQSSFSSHPTARLYGLDEDTGAGSGSGSVADGQRVNEILDANIDEMAQKITRLKVIGIALGEEIEQQNQLLGKIQDKVEIADIKIDYQNKDMNKLLGK